MAKRVYVSADYALDNGDRIVVNEIHRWCVDQRRNLDFYDTANPSFGSISSNPDCRPCDLKKEFNSQINASSAVIFVVGDKTSVRSAGCLCKRNIEGAGCECTPYKQNANGKKSCKWTFVVSPGPNDDLGEINTYSYLEHEFRQAVKRNKRIVIVYNSMNKQAGWLPTYMSEFEAIAHPFWKKDDVGNLVGDYQYIKESLGYE